MGRSRALIRVEPTVEPTSHAWLHELTLRWSSSLLRSLTSPPTSPPSPPTHDPPRRPQHPTRWIAHCTTMSPVLINEDFPAQGIKENEAKTLDQSVTSGRVA